MAARTRRRSIVGTLAALAVAVATLGACGEVDLPDITAPDITLPDITPPDITLPTFTPPDITLPTFPGGGDETPTGEDTPTVTVTETGPGETVTESLPGETITETVTATAAETTPPEPGPQEDPEDDGGIPWWVWLLVAAALAILAAVLFARRRAAARAYEAWAGRAEAAADRFAAVEDVLARPSTLDPADHQEVRHAVADARDLSVTFTRMADGAPVQDLARDAEEVADRLRSLATASEIENEGLVQRQLVSMAERQVAEDRRLAALREARRSVAQLIERVRG